MITLKAEKIKERLFGCYNENTGKIETERGGHIYCKNCYSNKGVYTRNYYCRGRLRLSTRCAWCGSKEIIDNWNGEILKQEQNMTQYEQFKIAFYNHLELLKQK